MKIRAKCPSLVELMMPEHENPSGNIFGGVLLSKIDIAGAVAARHVHNGRVVTVAMNSVIFKKPVMRGDLLICWAEVIKVGKTSITTKIRVEANRGGKIIPVTEAEATYVAVNAAGDKVPVGSTEDGAIKKSTRTSVCPACESDEEERCAKEAGEEAAVSKKGNKDGKKKKKNKDKKKKSKKKKTHK